MILLLVFGGVEEGWVFVTSALLDIAIAVAILGALEGGRDSAGKESVTKEPVLWEKMLCVECEACARNGDGVGVSFYDVSVLLGGNGGAYDDGNRPK